MFASTKGPSLNEKKPREILVELEKAHLVLVGCGSMGSALVSGWLAHPILEKGITIVTPRQESVAPFLEDPRVRWVSKPYLIQNPPNIVIFAVKPSQLEGLLPFYKQFGEHKTLFLTVVAGKTIDFYHRYLGNSVSLVRTIPNTPTAIQQGVILAYAPPTLSEGHRKLADLLMCVLGSVVWVSKEKQINMGAALTGCGPAYLFRFMESLIHAGVSWGFTQDQAEAMVRQLVFGSVAYLRQSQRGLTQLRDDVTSPGGMTEAGLKILDTQGLDQLVYQATYAAWERSNHL